MAQSDKPECQYARSACKTITLLVFVVSKLLPYFNVVRASFGEKFAEEEAWNLTEGIDR